VGFRFFYAFTARYGVDAAAKGGISLETEWFKFELSYPEEFDGE
jgi:hypothetical protein